jgi:hypothetical protein
MSQPLQEAEIKEQEAQQVVQEQTQQTTTEQPATQSVNPAETTPQQQPLQAVSATTSQNVTAPKPKADFTGTDATIQGLLVQVIALQHNKIQQLASNDQQQ